MLGDLGAKPLEAFLVDRGVDVAPPDPLLRAGLTDDELVLRRAAGVRAGVDRERPTFGDLCLAALECVRVELRGRRIRMDAALGADAVADEIVGRGGYLGTPFTVDALS